MKRVLTLILTIAMTVVSCTKEDKNGLYNRDGSPITQAQALKIVKNTIDEYDLVYITKSIVRKDVAFTTSLSVSGQTVGPLRFLDCDDGFRSFGGRWAKVDIYLC